MTRPGKQWLRCLLEAMCRPAGWPNGRPPGRNRREPQPAEWALEAYAGARAIPMLLLLGIYLCFLKFVILVVILV